MSKLVVAGCSFSDRTLVKKCYGDHLAKLLNLDYLHLAGGCGSNDRSIRLIVTNVLLNKINPGDHVIFQLTTSERKEVFSNFLTHTKLGKTIFDRSLQNSKTVDPDSNIKSIHPWDSMPLNDAHDNVVKDFRWSRFKMNSWQWQENKTDELFQKSMEEATVDQTANSYIIWTRLAMLMSFLETKNINYTVLHPHSYFAKEQFERMGLISLFREGKDISTHPELQSQWQQIQLAPDDGSHLSESGHEWFARWLKDKIS